MNRPEETLSEFERELVKALSRVDAPEGFTSRVLKEAASGAAPVRAHIWVMPFRMRMWAGGTLAAGLLLGTVAVERVHVQREREREQLAQQQFEMAMQITGDALDHVRQQLRDAGIEIGH